FFLFFFQAEDGIRDFHVTGVQTCALPISKRHLTELEAVLEAGPYGTALSAGATGTAGPVGSAGAGGRLARRAPGPRPDPAVRRQIGRASCREREKMEGGGGMSNGLRVRSH